MIFYNIKIWKEFGVDTAQLDIFTNGWISELCPKHWEAEVTLTYSAFCNSAVKKPRTGLSGMEGDFICCGKGLTGLLYDTDSSLMEENLFRRVQLWW